jgi:hypothetical protein
VARAAVLLPLYQPDARPKGGPLGRVAWPENGHGGYAKGPGQMGDPGVISHEQSALLKDAGEFQEIRGPKHGPSSCIPVFSHQGTHRLLVRGPLQNQRTELRTTVPGGCQEKGVAFRGPVLANTSASGMEDQRNETPFPARPDRFDGVTAAAALKREKRTLHRGG